jgi:sugar lactone lactonase YvrE
MGIVAHLRSEVLRDGYGYLEAPRWHDGALWFSDLQRKRIERLAPDGTTTTVAEVPGTPCGLGFTPDGELLAVSADDLRLVRIDDGKPVEYADLSGHGVFAGNDMTVDAAGRVYVGTYGYDLFGGQDPTPSRLVLVHPDGRVQTTGDPLVFPNGIALSADGRTLVVAESFGFRLTAFDVDDDGELRNGRLFAQLDDPATGLVDGIAMDVAGGVWVGCPMAGEYRRFVEGGTITDTIRPADGATFGVSLVFGGDDLRTLYLTVADTDLEKLGDGWGGTARIEQVRVEVPGVPATGSV